MKTKICSKCKTEKTIENFYKDKCCKDGYRYQCIDCYYQYIKKERPIGKRGKDKQKRKPKVADEILKAATIKCKGRIYDIASELNCSPETLGYYNSPKSKYFKPWFRELRDFIKKPKRKPRTAKSLRCSSNPMVLDVMKKAILKTDGAKKVKSFYKKAGVKL